MKTPKYIVTQIFNKKDTLSSVIVLLLVGIFLLTFYSCSSEDENPQNEFETLSTLEIDNLKFLREEEKLARDVYLYSYTKYGITIFNNIANSEQQHMNQVLTVLNNYSIEDPASSVKGVFNDQTIQKLYDDLTNRSDISLVEALKVGAYIEDFDINDLVGLKTIINKQDITTMIDLLYCGSRNHLRSYVNQLNMLNEKYIPEFITSEEYDLIIDSNTEKCGQ